MSPRSLATAVLDTGNPMAPDLRERAGVHGGELVVLTEPGTPAWLGSWLTDVDRPVVQRRQGRGPGLMDSLARRAGGPVLVARGPGRTSATDGPLRVTVALAGLPDDAPVLAEAVLAARALDADLELVHAVPVSFGERSVGMEQALRRADALLSDAAELVEVLGADRPHVRLARVRPYELVGEELTADLVVVGGARRVPGRISGLGLVTGSAVQHAPCPVLVVPRDGA